MSFRLAIVAGKGSGREFFFAQKSVRIGRRADNDLVLYDTAVSRAHCEVSQEGEGFLVRDLGSANGVLLNEQLVTEAALHEGDRITIGPVVFELRLKKVPQKTEPSQPQMFAPEKQQDREEFENLKTSAHERPSLEAVEKSVEMQRAERRTDTGSFASGPRRGLMQRLASMPRETRRAVLIAAAVVSVGAFVAIGIVLMKPPKDRSGELFAIDATTAALRFGAGKVDVFTPDRCNFQFAYGGGRVTAGFAIGGVEGPKELLILVNGKDVDYAPLSPNQWSFGHSRRLPRQLLKPGTNILTFDDTRTPQSDERWGVSQVTITETPLPPPDEKRAAQLFQLGKNAYDTRSVTPPNLWRALAYFDEAKSFLESLPKLPALYAELEQAEDKADLELQGVFDSHVFAAEKAQRFGNADEAAQLLRELLSYFPDSTDTRHKQAKARLSQLQSGEIQ